LSPPSYLQFHFTEKEAVIQWLQDEKTKKTQKLSFGEWTIDKKKIWNNINDRCLFCICEKRIYSFEKSDWREI